MLDNVARKLTLILAVLVFAAAFLVFKDPPFTLGLDLQGGTRLVYSFEFPDEPGVDRSQLLAENLSIIRTRLDPTGTLEATLRPEGDSRIVIELPGNLGVAGQIVQLGLAEDLGDGDTSRLLLEDSPVVDEFQEIGGKVRLGEEVIRYDQRVGRKLMRLTRGQGGTPVTAHAAGTTVELVSDDAIRRRIESLGELSFQIVASAGDLVDLDTDLEAEKELLRVWAAANPGTAIDIFNRVGREQGGPHEILEWYEVKEGTHAGPDAVQIDLGEGETLTAAPVLAPAGEDDSFRGGDLEETYRAQDQTGYPAVGFEFKVGRKHDFRRFTAANENRQMAIMLNGILETAPNIEEALPGSGIIRGRYTEQEVTDMIMVLRSGSLKLRPILEYEEKVGATLGQDYVKRGFYSGVLALVLVLAFMAVYYRGLGLYAAVALLSSFLMLMGGLSFLDATLTLPGIAGIILTVGMAVDANILIFDRIREESEKGRNVKQAAKTGFEMARSAILDANITTFLTAVILYKVGTGPVRGFAVTLMIGIVASVFAALVITRVLVHFGLVRGRSSYSMGQWMVKANYALLSKAKIAMPISLILIISGIALFWVTPTKDKLGIDFLGGSELVLRTAKAENIDTLRARVAEIPDLGEKAEVVPILSSEEESDFFTEFRARFKAEGESEQGQGEVEFEGLVSRHLSDLLLENPVTVTVREEGAEALLDMTLIFEETHPTEDVQGVLVDGGLRDVEVTRAADRQNTFEVTAHTTAGRTPEDVRTLVEQAFRIENETTGSAYLFALAIPSTSTVGPQVVGELRDKAVLALLISLFIIVLYIRVRFAEYSYGFAAVAALVHDVAITLGVLTLFNRLGILSGEITLPMIAAFLTIIGYSLNDTIVIFDRVRENLPRMKKPLVEVLNTSINQTLSRTILTSVTTLVAVGVLFAANYGTGNVLESFSFAMMIGVLTGTYSTIFIANPVLLWIEGRHDRAKARSSSGKKREETNPQPAG